MKIVEQYQNSLGIFVVTVEYEKDKSKSIAKWCREHECGKQVAIDKFAFKEEELTMFQLRWES